MKTVIITDGKYRSAIAAARTFSRAGWQVVVTQTREDTKTDPPVFASRHVSERRWIDGAAADAAYPDRLLALTRAYARPVLFCVGAVTLAAVSRERERFAQSCDFLIAPPDVLDALNDKETVHRRALELGLPVPREYDGAPDRYPVVIKPRCGEKFGLKAADRYRIAANEAEYAAALEAMRRYDDAPLVQECVAGAGMGVSLVLDGAHRPAAAICHRRIREYPIAGGPSACCESIYDAEKIEQACRLLRSFDFVGIAMVEFKGDCILEVNPRVWGSFPLTACANSPFALRYAEAASGTLRNNPLCDYETGVRMRFLLNDALATLQLLGRGRLREGFAGIGDLFRAREALADRDDPGPLRAYVRAAFRGVL